MPAVQTIALVTQEPATAKAVAAALTGADAPRMGETHETFEALVGQLRQHPIAAALIDIDPASGEQLAALEPVVSRFPETRFIVLSGTIDSALMLRAMEAGARHFLSKDAIAADLLDVLRRLTPDASDNQETRRNIVPILAASGGCGATTVAINLTNELHLLSTAPALLVDLDCHFGVADSYLGLSGTYSLTDVLTRPGEIDSELVRSTAVDYNEGFHLLRSPAANNLPSESPMDPARLSQVVAACGQAYAFTVLDAPRIPMSVAADLAGRSAMTLIVLQMTIKDLRVARSMLAALAAAGVPEGRVVPVINRYCKRGLMIAAEEARKALGRPFGTIANDYRNTVRSINYGQPLEQIAPRSQCRRELKELAETVIQKSEDPDSVGMSR